MTVHCNLCGSTNLRPAHFQLRDLAYLVTLRSPVRCRYCRMRFHVHLFNALRIRRGHHARRVKAVQVGRA